MSKEPTPIIDTANNCFNSGQGYSYDLTGNVITDAQGRTFAYDAENKQKEVKDSKQGLVKNKLGSLKGICYFIQHSSFDEIRIEFQNSSILIQRKTMNLRIV